MCSGRCVAARGYGCPTRVVVASYRMLGESMEMEVDDRAAARKLPISTGPAPVVGGTSPVGVPCPPGRYDTVRAAWSSCAH